MTHEMTLRVGAHGDRVSALTLPRLLDAFTDVLRATGVDDWEVADLATGSAVLTFRPVNDVPEGDNDALDALAGLADLPQADGRVPPGWNPTMVDAVARLGSEAKRAETPVSVTTSSGTTPIDSAFFAAVKVVQQAAARRRRHSYGSVAGVLDRISLRNRTPEFGLVDEATGVAVRVTFDESDLERVRDALGNRVEVSGPLTRDLDGRKHEIHAEQLIVAASRARSKLRVKDMVGLFGPDPSGLDSVEWVRAERDS